MSISILINYWLVNNKLQLNGQNMIVNTDGYHALIEYLTEHLSIFANQQGDTGEETVEDIVNDLVASNLMVVFQQNPELDPDVRFTLLREADAVVDDLGEVLAGEWVQKATNEQVMFLDDYIGLIKNLFDSAFK
ncbi:topoisomerase II [Aliivibrio fischeri]|nr:topoisomerase II [Aliivibrio fischeri]